MFFQQKRGGKKPTTRPEIQKWWKLRRNKEPSKQKVKNTRSRWSGVANPLQRQHSRLHSSQPRAVRLGPPPHKSLILFTISSWVMFGAILSHCHRLGTSERKHHYLEIQTTLMNQLKNNETWKAGLKQKQASKACIYNQKNPYERNLKLKMHKVEKPKYRERRTSKGNMEKGDYKAGKKGSW